MPELQTGPNNSIPVAPWTNAALLVQWCSGDISAASRVAQETSHRYILWNCSADPESLARELIAKGQGRIVPPEFAPI